jgi:serine/threonine protein kinase
MRYTNLKSDNKKDLKQEIKKTLGSGQFGTAFLKKNKVYKITTSVDEFTLANNIKKTNKIFKSIVKIFGTRKLTNNKFLIIREYINEIPDDFAEYIGENIYEIIDFFFEKNMDIRKSQTNLTELFESNFLDFLQTLKKEIISLGYKPVNFDMEGLPLNIGIDNNGNYKLFDF